MGLLTRRGVDLHAGSEYVFRRACEKGHIEVIKYLLQLGICSDIRDYCRKYMGLDEPLFWHNVRSVKSARSVRS